MKLKHVTPRLSFPACTAMPKEAVAFAYLRWITNHATQQCYQKHAYKQSYFKIK